ARGHHGRGRPRAAGPGDGRAGRREPSAGLSRLQRGPSANRSWTSGNVGCVRIVAPPSRQPPDPGASMSRDTRQRYGTISRFFHWAIALLVAWQALKLFDRIDDGEHWVGQTLVPWHVSIGVLVLLLVVPRIVWA